LSLAMLRGGVLSRRARGETTMMPLSGSTGPLAEELYHLRASWGWFLLAGIVLILLGFLAISSAFIAGLLSVLTLGFLLMVCGVAEAVGSFGARRWGGFFLQLIAGVLYFFLGLMMVRRPLMGLEIVTLLISVGLLVEGVTRIVFAVTHRF